MTANLPEVMTTKEVADFLRIDVQNINKWIRAGKLRAYRVGRENRVMRNDFETFLENRQTCKEETPE